jgi:hypothetical protein
MITVATQRIDHQINHASTMFEPCGCGQALFVVGPYEREVMPHDASWPGGKTQITPSIRRSVMAVEGRRLRDHEADDPLVEGLVVRVDEFDQDLVRPRGKAVDYELLAARIGLAPRRIIHGHMDVPDVGDTSSAFGPNTGTIRRFSARYWMTTRPWTSESASGGSMTIFAAGSLASGTTGAGPRISLAVCAIAVDAHRTAVAPIRPMTACLMMVSP